MKPDTSFVLKSGHFHLLTTLPVGRLSDRIGNLANQSSSRSHRFQTWVYAVGMATTPEAKPQCSFCKKSQDAVAVLIANPPTVLPRVYICDECIAVCAHVLKERRSPKAESSVGGE
jgi:hypothetical protein